MRIALVSTLCTPVRRDDSGSVESLVWLLSRELSWLGHEVTVFATGDSQPWGELVAALPAPYGRAGAPGDWHLCEWINLSRAVAESGRFDIVHSHAYLWGLPLEPLGKAPMVFTLHVLPGEDEAALWRMRPDACVTALSRAQWAAFPDLQPAATVPHGVGPEQFTFRPEAGDYVCYLGRFISDKGPLAAVAAARAAGVRLVLAGPHSAHYRDHVAPLVDGRTVEYVGYLTGAERDRLLGGARALLYPLQYAEPFGLVLIEAMMCGTPVVATRLGAVPEVVDDGVTGFLADSTDEIAPLIPRALELDRGRVRRTAEDRFSAGRMARDYVRVYERLVGPRHGS